MKTIILFISFLSMTVWAAQDISCWNNDCLKNGWTQTDLISTAFTDFQCYRDGCRNSGWIVGGLQNISYYTQCKAGGCFVNGWFEITRDTQETLRQIVCVDHDCLKNGWMTYSKSDSFKTSCLKNSCTEEGWRTFRNSAENEINYCKRGGCFISGWINSTL